MKKKLLSILVAMTLSTALLVSSCGSVEKTNDSIPRQTQGNAGETNQAVDQGEAIVFTSKDLEDSIRSYVSKPSGDIYPSDMEKIIGLVLFNPIVDVSPLKYCKNIETLEMQNTDLVDASPLAELKKFNFVEAVL